MVSEYINFIYFFAQQENVAVAHILDCCTVGEMGRWLVGGKFLFQNITGKNVTF